MLAIYTSSNESHKVGLDIIGKNKKIPNTVLELPSYILKELLITYAKFDRTIDKRTNCNCMTIYSTDEHNIDMLQKWVYLQECDVLKDRLQIRK